MTDSSRGAPNRLIHETSPYLQQHAFNPVDWYPWSDEAIEVARQTQRPIFLSIGYSACHWCHVMEHESFEHPEIAKLMNEHFVCIKVDREERPDLDHIYMTAVQVMTGHGGWPMSVFLTPDLKPFFGGTYWPPEPRPGYRMPGFRQILLAVHDAWLNRRAGLEENAVELTSTIERAAAIDDEQQPLDANILLQTERVLLRATDRTHGGFGSAPKFPHPMDLRVLLRTWQRFGHDDARHVVTLTLDKMANGGIYDHLGGGFHRYSTDARWLAPHFEKMLYDNALLVSTYLEAFQATGDAEYSRVVRETLDYVLREMTQPQGGFYSTQDADSEGEEGKFFVWSEAEIRQLLPAQDADCFCRAYDVTPSGNWEGHSILNRPRSAQAVAQELGVSVEDLEVSLARSRTVLFAARAKRIAPGRDDKVLVGWNGLMIAAMAQASSILNEPRYAEAAIRAADFILTRMRDEHGRLWHAFKDEQARFNAYLDDYACLIDGLVDVTQATGQARFLTAALELAERLIAQFHDPDEGGFYYTSNDHERLIARLKDAQDNATPSGNGMTAFALLKLGRLTGRSDLIDYSVQTMNVMSGQLTRSAMASGQMLMALDAWLGASSEYVLVEGTAAAANEAAWHALHRAFIPNKVAVRVSATTTEEPLSALCSGKVAVNGEPTLYVCQFGACQSPIVGVPAIEAAFSESSRSRCD